ncbi:SDR family oxidoreductase [Shewanella carassii]|uniref:Protein YeeZ n=1 Tax=Shewanella carassii TaxID=1987584 RepID=A0ABQ1SW49_9GAMM|nr:SDR family oxidoreductase [Shewanella carassii]GGE67962.1 protein YeeZ [Shewanella carassii]
MKHIAVWGCGWFGLPLARTLLASGIKVCGSKRTEEGAELLRKEGIDAVTLNLAEPAPLPSLPDDCDALVLNIPPGLRRGDNDYLPSLERLLPVIAASSIKRLLFISSSGVYPQSQGVVTETTSVDAPSDSYCGTLAMAEHKILALANEGLQVTVIRFAGLVGPGRHPGRFLAGKTGLPGANAVVNLVHLDDCINACLKLLTAANPGAIYNLCSPCHPTRQEFYPAAAKALGLASPEFAKESETGKWVDGSLICRELDFEYSYPDADSLIAACR